MVDLCYCVVTGCMKYRNNAVTSARYSDDITLNELLALVGNHLEKWWWSIGRFNMAQMSDQVNEGENELKLEPTLAIFHELHISCVTNHDARGRLIITTGSAV